MLTWARRTGVLAPAARGSKTALQQLNFERRGVLPACTLPMWSAAASPHEAHPIANVHMALTELLMCELRRCCHLPVVRP